MPKIACQLLHERQVLHLARAFPLVRNVLFASIYKYHIITVFISLCPRRPQHNAPTDKPTDCPNARATLSSASTVWPSLASPRPKTALDSDPPSMSSWVSTSVAEQSITPPGASSRVYVRDGVHSIAVAVLSSRGASNVILIWSVRGKKLKKSTAVVALLAKARQQQHSETSVRERTAS